VLSVKYKLNSKYILDSF